MDVEPKVARRALLAGAAASLMLPHVARAQGFPAKPVRIIVPYPPGGSVDGVGRLLAQELQASGGWNVVVENKGGAAGAVGTREVARAEPDGHTLVLGTNQTHATNAVLLKEPGYDPVADFAAIAGLADLQHALVVPKAAAAGTLAEFIALARAQAGTLNYGSSGAGSASHLAMELFKARTGIEMQHVAFRGAAPLALEIVAGRIDAACVTLPSVLSLVESGDMRALGLASQRRAPQLRHVPTFAEEGVSGAEADAWIALFAPARIAAQTRDVLTSATMKAFQKSEVVALATAQGVAVNVRAGPAFAAFQREEVQKWAEVARRAKVAAE